MKPITLFAAAMLSTGSHAQKSVDYHMACMNAAKGVVYEKLSRNPQPAADCPSMAKAAAGCGVLLRDCGSATC